MNLTVNRNNIEIVDDVLADVLRQKTPAERIAMAGDANDSARLMTAAGIRYQHPGWANDDVAREVARRMLGAAD